MVVLFVDMVIIIRRFLPRYEETRLARPAVFYTCAVIGGLSGLVAVIATLSGSWTPLISNDSGTVSIGGATAAYGVWFYLVAGIAALSLLVAVGINLLGNATSARAAGTTQQAKRATTSITKTPEHRSVVDSGCEVPPEKWTGVMRLAGPR
jgi:hypothetical protein